MPRVRPIEHEDRLTLVDHLDELRTRIIIALGALLVATSLCFWQNHLILEIVNEPLPSNLPEPITFGVTEPFTTTLTNAAYFGILLALPVILYQVYAFVLPAFSPTRAPGRHAAAADGAVPVHRGRRLLLLRRAHAGHGLPAQLQRATSSTPRSGRATTTAS